MSCRYQSKDMSLMVKQTVMKNPSQTQGWDSALAGKKMKLPNDPDNAQVQTDQGDNTNPNIHYARQGDIVEIRMMGIGKTNPAFEAIQKKITSLRRQSYRSSTGLTRHFLDLTILECELFRSFPR
jgi:hypothetical protein